jgi:hypothetical protein
LARVVAVVLDGEHFDGEDAIEMRIPREQHGAHAAAAEPLDDFVPADSRWRWVGHGARSRGYSATALEALATTLAHAAQQ